MIRAEVAQSVGCSDRVDGWAIGIWFPAGQDFSLRQNINTGT